MTGLQTTSLKRSGTGWTFQMSLAAPPVDLQVHRKGRCFASCCSGGALDHKRQQQLSFSFLTSILVKINPASALFSCILIPNLHRNDPTSDLTQNANLAPFQQLIANVWPLWRDQREGEKNIVFWMSGAPFFFHPSDTTSPPSYTLPPPVYNFQLQQRRKTLTSRLHLAPIDRFHAFHSFESMRSLEEISTSEDLKMREKNQQQQSVHSGYDSNESFSGQKQDEQYSINIIYKLKSDTVDRC